MEIQLFITCHYANLNHINMTSISIPNLMNRIKNEDGVKSMTMACLSHTVRLEMKRLNKGEKEGRQQYADNSIYLGTKIFMS